MTERSLLADLPMTMFAVRVSVLNLTNAGMHVAWYATCERCGDEVVDALTNTGAVAVALYDHVHVCPGSR